MKDLLIRQIIGNDYAVVTEDGDKVFQLLSHYLIDKETVTLDFEGVDLLTTAFLNSAIGQLYGNSTFTSEFLNTHLKLKNIAPEDKHLFVWVIERAKQYFKDKKGFDNSADKAIYGDK
ncbi:STAS-like domain-containing protein [Edaphocola flava]|uniref:STAS-like domain-containing protein n=1 Tax=Edaphocola flava TaxID=2499629 RepID=UPI00100BB684|nr:STAS-like domain-containing protein [Edaphocola flava]